jgi:hypothetical protein
MTRTIVFLLYPGLQILDPAGPFVGFELATGDGRPSFGQPPQALRRAARP